MKRNLIGDSARAGMTLNAQAARTWLASIAILALCSATAFAQTNTERKTYTPPPPAYHPPVERPEPRPEPRQQPEPRPEPRPAAPAYHPPQERPQQERQPEYRAPEQRHDDIRVPEHHEYVRPGAVEAYHAPSHVGEPHFGVRTQETFRVFSAGPLRPVHMFAYLPNIAIVPRRAYVIFPYAGGFPELPLGRLAWNMALAGFAATGGIGCESFYSYDDSTQIFDTCNGTAIEVSAAFYDGTIMGPIFLQEGWIRDDGTDGGNAVVPPGVVKVGACTYPFKPLFDTPYSYQCTVQ